MERVVDADEKTKVPVCSQGQGWGMGALKYLILTYLTLVCGPWREAKYRVSPRTVSPVLVPYTSNAEYLHQFLSLGVNLIIIIIIISLTASKIHFQDIPRSRT